MCCKARRMVGTGGTGSEPGELGLARHASINSRALWPWYTAAHQLGVSPQLQLAHLGLSEGQLRDPGERVSYATTMALFERLVRITGRRDLGLVAARAVEPGHFELLELVMRSSDTLGLALKRLVRFFAVVDDGGAMVLKRDPTYSELSYQVTCGLPVYPAYTEFLSAMLLLAARRETGVDALSGHSMAFPHAGPADVAPYEELFASQVHFEAPEAVAVLRNHDLALPLRRANAALQRSALNAITAWFDKTGS